MDLLTIEDWWDIQKQTLEFGFTLYDLQVERKPKEVADEKGETSVSGDGNIQLSSGSFTAN